MKEFELFRELYDKAEGDSSKLLAVKRAYMSSPICKEIQFLMATRPIVIHLGSCVKTLLFKDKDSDVGQFVAISSDATDKEVRMHTIALLECAREYYEHQDFHREITNLNADRLIRFGIKKYQVPVTSYHNLSQAEIFALGNSDTRLS